MFSKPSLDYLPIPFGTRRPLERERTNPGRATKINSMLPRIIEMDAKRRAKALEKIPPRYNDALVGFVIAAVGFYILLAGWGTLSDAGDDQSDVQRYYGAPDDECKDGRRMPVHERAHYIPFASVPNQRIIGSGISMLRKTWL